MSGKFCYFYKKSFLCLEDRIIHIFPDCHGDKADTRKQYHKACILRSILNAASSLVFSGRTGPGNSIHQLSFKLKSSAWNNLRNMRKFPIIYDTLSTSLPYQNPSEIYKIHFIQQRWVITNCQQKVSVSPFKIIIRNWKCSIIWLPSLWLIRTKMTELIFYKWKDMPSIKIYLENLNLFYWNTEQNSRL